MRAGIFMMPTHPPERDIYQGNEWDLQMIRWAEELGYDEAWIGEHLTLAWEPNAAPDLTIAQALQQTRRIRIGPGGHCLSYHNPGKLAARIAFLDHLSRGRYMLGCAAGIAESDMRRVGQRAIDRERMREVLDTMIAIWTAQGETMIETPHYRAELIQQDVPLTRHLKPFQRPHPPVAITAVSPNSPNLRYAGSRGFIPLSLLPSLGHWDTYRQGAEEAGVEPDRRHWRMVETVFVADTDREAYRWSVESHLGRTMGEYVLPVFQKLGVFEQMKGGQDIPDATFTPAWLARHAWLIGSPQTVAEKLQQRYHDSGGFGVLLIFCFDYADDPTPWRRSMELLMTEVLPTLPDLETPTAAAGAAKIIGQN